MALTNFLLTNYVLQRERYFHREFHISSLFTVWWRYNHIKWYVINILGEIFIIENVWWFYLFVNSTCIMLVSKIWISFNVIKNEKQIRKFEIVAELFLKTKKKMCLVRIWAKCNLMCVFIFKCAWKNIYSFLFLNSFMHYARLNDKTNDMPQNSGFIPFASHQSDEYSSKW